jgi:threonyl-tRNA synthetase
MMLQVVGEKEKENRTVNVRTRDNIKHGEYKLADVIEVLRKERGERSLESTFGHNEVQQAAQPAANGAPENGLADQPGS